MKWSARTSLDLEKTPCRGGQVKYCSPPTVPSFFPCGVSSSTPAHSPGANLVSPMKRTVPGLLPPTYTRSPTEKLAWSGERCKTRTEIVRPVLQVWWPSCQPASPAVSRWPWQSGGVRGWGRERYLGEAGLGQSGDLGHR